mgnify:CR=1 FL=1
MYGGRIMEFGDTKTILNNPVNPYTIKLIESFRRSKNNRMTTIPGSVKPLVDELKVISDAYTLSLYAIIEDAVSYSADLDDLEPKSIGESLRVGSIKNIFNP